jgi:hypothetical protein
MSEIQVPAQVSASSYRAPVEPALSLKSELESYDRNKDRRSLLLCAEGTSNRGPVRVKPPWSPFKKRSGFLWEAPSLL